MFNSQGPHQQPPWQTGLYPPPTRTGPPPAKKPKNNPIITRYPPPPGYRGPAQPHAAPYSQSPAWQTPGQPYSFPQPGYLQQAYSAPQTQPVHQFLGYPPQTQYPQASYPAPIYYQPPLVHSQSYPTPPPITWPQSAQAALPPSFDPSQQTQPQRRHLSAPSLTGAPGFASSFVGASGLDPTQVAVDEDLEEDFDAECYFATRPDEIDPNFSLGMIEWKAPLPTKRPLPATFAEAELEALAPRKPRASDDESISDYFIKSRRHEAFLSVRLTEFWPEVKDDIIFKEFPVVCPEILTMSELLAKYKDRPDPTWFARVDSPTPQPESVAGSDAYGGEMEVDGSYIKSDETANESEYPDEQPDFLGSLEQAIQQNGTSHSRHHSRASSVASTSSRKITRPQPLVPIRDQAQEDVLAALGVTGSPKMVYETPGPAIGPSQQQRDGATSRGSRHNSVTSINGRFQPPRPPPPPPPPSGRQQYGQQYSRNGYDRDRRGSDASHHTVMGSDFEDNDATPRPKTYGTDKRKRAHDDSEDDGSGYVRRHDNDETPKQRRKQPRVSDPYKDRRW